MGAKEDFEVFRSALVYTITLRIVGFVTQQQEGSVLTLAALASILTYTLRTLNTSVLLYKKNVTGPIATPCFGLLEFLFAFLISAGIHMQSTLLGTFVSTLFTGEIPFVFVVGSSAVGITLMWVLGRTVGALAG